MHLDETAALEGNKDKGRGNTCCFIEVEQQRCDSRTWLPSPGARRAKGGSVIVQPDVTVLTAVSTARCAF